MHCIRPQAQKVEVEGMQVGMVNQKNHLVEPSLRSAQLVCSQAWIDSACRHIMYKPSSSLPGLARSESCSMGQKKAQERGRSRGRRRKEEEGGRRREGGGRRRKKRIRRNKRMEEEEEVREGFCGGGGSRCMGRRG